MALRLIRIVIPEQEEQAAKNLLEDQGVKRFWLENAPDGLFVANVLVSSESTESLLDVMEKRFASYTRFQMVILPVEAAFPREIKKPGGATGNGNGEEDGKATAAKKNRGRVHRQELYTDARDVSSLTWNYLIMVLLSSFVAAIGLLRDNVAVVIGAMVIAPLLGPNVSLALAATLGDPDLAKRAIKTLMAGVALAFVLSIGLGLSLHVDAAGREIASRTTVDFIDLVLALAAGVAGALSFNQGTSSALIGVMVAVALLPPLAVCGMLLGSGHTPQALGAFLLFGANTICVNLAGVITFAAQGVRPNTFWEADLAKKYSRYAVEFWILLLCVLAFFLVQSR
ncbi:conserved hypothetical protein [Desulfatibacillum aliphaticivorans]|uniref:TIGR00341 family protein n=1 Tax=Desulfatibacillum aliphaticivorans TaxID=218208 RepID=B8FKB0_DESAL|nr:TIGR00341 family protein [Desulfatibacillum aliphaticivorans]ACL01725.1 conserved hypothetical protein [Desulfatibacillum aliphaticivorans]